MGNYLLMWETRLTTLQQGSRLPHQTQIWCGILVLRERVKLPFMDAEYIYIKTKKWSKHTISQSWCYSSGLRLKVIRARNSTRNSSDIEISLSWPYSDHYHLSPDNSFYVGFTFPILLWISTIVNAPKQDPISSPFSNWVCAKLSPVRSTQIRKRCFFSPISPKDSKIWLTVKVNQSSMEWIRTTQTLKNGRQNANQSGKNCSM